MILLWISRFSSSCTLWYIYSGMFHLFSVLCRLSYIPSLVLHYNGVVQYIPCRTSTQHWSIDLVGLHSYLHSFGGLNSHFVPLPIVFCVLQAGCSFITDILLYLCIRLSFLSFVQGSEVYSMNYPELFLLHLRFRRCAIVISFLFRCHAGVRACNRSVPIHPWQFIASKFFSHRVAVYRGCTVPVVNFFVAHY